MAAALLYLPANRAFNSNGIGVPGAVAELYVTGTVTPASFYANSALSVSLGSSITANAAGRFAPAYQDETVPFRLIVKDSAGVELDDIDPYYFGTLYGTVISTAGTVAATRAALAALVGVAGNAVVLSEAGREGTFVWSASNLATKVSADTAQGLYVAPVTDTTGTSGAWVRKFSGPVNPTWFGVVEGNAAGANGAANSTALTAMFAALRTRAVNASTFYQGLESVLFPAGYFEFGSTIDLTDGTCIFEGAGTGQTGGISTLLKFPTATTGIRVQDYNTSGGTGTRAAAKSAAGSIIRHFSIDGALVGSPVTESESHGVQLRARATVEHCRIGSFPGDGIHIKASVGGGSDEGNANNFQLLHNTVNACRNGLYVDGADVNAGVVYGGDYSSCRQWGVWDSSFLGNTYLAVHTASNGWDGAATSTPTGTTIGGSRYYVKTGQAAGASTNAPKSSTVTITIASPAVVSWASHGLTAGQQVTFSTTGALPTGLTAETLYYIVNPGANDFQVSATLGGAAINTSGTQSGTHTSGAAVDNTWWGFTGAGGVYNGIVPWVTATTFREGGAYHNDGVSGRNVFLGCYSESDQNASQFAPLTVVSGGLHAANMDEYPGNLSVGANGGFILVSPTISETQAATDLVFTQTGGVVGASKLAVSGASASYGAVIETTHAANQLADLVFKTTAATNHGIRYERRAGTFLDSNNSSWEFQLGVPGSGLYMFGDGGAKVTGSINATVSYKANGTKVIGLQGAAVADAAALTSVDGTAIAGGESPTEAEHNALIAEFNKLRTDVGAIRTTLNTYLARSRAHGLIAT